MSRACLLTLAVLAHLAGGEVPYGHRDFYPSPDRPVGFCGDGNGWYPGATPVAEFWEGTPTRTTMPMHHRREGMVDTEVWDLADEESHNIAWKTRMPSWSNSQPTVVGDRVFTQAEPYSLVCCDANTGEILWTVEANPWLGAGADRETAERAKRMHEVWRAIPFWPAMIKDSTVYRGLRAEEWQHVLPIYEEQVLPRLLAELAKLDPGTDYAAAAEKSLASLKMQRDGLLAGEKRPKLPRKTVEALHALIERRIQQVTREWTGNPREGGRVRMNLSWGYEVGTMVAPVSDGERVYAEFAYGSTICVGLDGEIRWLRWFPDDQRTPCQSPLLVDGVLVSMHAKSALRGLDAETGELLWEAPTNSDRLGKNKGGYYVGSHKVVELADGDAKREVLVTTMCNIIRPEDGKVVGHLPWPYDYGPSGGPSVVSSGDVVIRASNGDGGGSPLVAYRLVSKDRDTVVAEKLWERGPKGSPGYSQLVATDRFFVFDGGGKAKLANIAVAETGEAIYPGFDRNRRIGELSDILAGNVYCYAVEGNRGELGNWKGRRHDGKALARFCSYDLSDPAAPKELSQRNLLGGTEFPGMPAMERLAPELYADPWFKSSAWGKPCHRLHTDCAITALGNRLFIRTIDALYAIGDPATPYDWNPDSRPAGIRVSRR